LAPCFLLYFYYSKLGIFGQPKNTPKKVVF